MKEFKLNKKLKTMTKAPSVRKMAKSYLILKKRLLKNSKFINMVKMSLAAGFFLFSLVAYWYFVNVSSTKGYFIRTERENFSEIKFQNEIVKIDVRKLESKIFDSINLESNSSITWKVLTISSITSVALR